MSIPDSPSESRYLALQLVQVTNFPNVPKHLHSVGIISECDLCTHFGRHKSGQGSPCTQLNNASSRKAGSLLPNILCKGDTTRPYKQSILLFHVLNYLNTEAICVVFVIAEKMERDRRHLVADQ
uniref:Uncharacterized protein n=1 Tax=Opuntia streptacantha TaxID=393608 RepID=A0A7C9E7Y0_OPUST